MNHFPAKTFLNVGGNSKKVSVPKHYEGWNHILLDIDPKCSPDILCDARELHTTPEGIYDAIYCSHTLEHFLRHEVSKVLSGFLHVLKLDGFAEIIVPDIDFVMKYVVKNGLDLTDVLYQSAAGPICAIDSFYGHGAGIQRHGEFFVHKTGFSPKSLVKMLLDNGFYYVIYYGNNFDMRAFAFKQVPTESHKKLLNIKVRV